MKEKEKRRQKTRTRTRDTRKTKQNNNKYETKTTMNKKQGKQKAQEEEEVASIVPERSLFFLVNGAKSTLSGNSSHSTRKRGKRRGRGEWELQEVCGEIKGGRGRERLYRV